MRKLRVEEGDLITQHFFFVAHYRWGQRNKLVTYFEVYHVVGAEGQPSEMLELVDIDHETATL